MRRIRSHLTFANIAAGLALVIALASGTAYAADTVFSTDIVDGEVKAADIASNAVGSGKVSNNQVKSVDVRDDTLLEGGLGSSDIAAGAITAADVAGESLTGDQVADESLTVSDITDESLTGAVVANDSLNGKDISELSGNDVNDNTLTGADIANTASGADNVNADRVDGRHVCRGEASAGTSFTTLCAAGGLIVEGVCTPLDPFAAEGTVRLRTTQANNAFYVIDGPFASSDANFGTADGPVTLVRLRANGTQVTPTITHFHASSETGQLTGSIAARVASFTSTIASCEFTMDILG